ncbi:MAG: DEAD/DEAH box helicase, partial [Verrucomicrobiota bacterium]
MNFDRATLNFLNEFPEKVRQEGEALQKDGCVTQIFGNHHYVQGRVEVDRGQVFQTTLTLNDNKWVGTSTSSHGNQCSSLVATMLERIERGEDLPEAPNEVGQKSLPEILEDGLGRELTPSEDGFLNKLERRFRRFMIEKKLFDHDLVRLNPKWEVASYDPLKLWPTPPEDIVEFWNYIAYAFDKKGLRPPEFLRPVTDLDAIRQKLQSWEDERKIGEWEDRMSELNAEAPAQLPVQGEFRLLIKPSEAVLQWKEEGADSFASVGTEVELARLLELHDLGALVLGDQGALLWMHFLAHRQQTGADEVRLENEENGRFLNRLFLQKELRDSMVTLDESPFVFVEDPLRWQCVDADKAAMEAGLAEAGAGIELRTAEGERVPYTLRLLRGAESLYLADDTVFRGARFWGEETEVMPRYEIPEMVLASESGVEFLGRIDAELPPSLKDRVRDETMHVTVRAELAQKISSADSEHVLLDIAAADAAGRRKEIYDRDGWRIDQRGKGEGETIFRFNRRILYRMPVILERLNVSWEPSREMFKARVSKQFPERFSEWARSLPAEVTLELDENLQSLLADPVKASLKFEVVNEEIDWFDLKIVLKVEGHDLSQEEIRSLVAARGSFVRMKQGGWLRLELDMEEEQMQAVSRLGLDPFDLSEESHRMHALQLADSRAKEVFDPRAWNRICERSDQVTLRVRPNVPSLVTADLRSYQVEGFHFLAYLSANNFGGILADDMGLGKTVQSLTWLAWLRAKVENGNRPLPSLVVCPKSVLDVWAGEVEKFTPTLKVQVLRSKEELDVG